MKRDETLKKARRAVDSGDESLAMESALDLARALLSAHEELERMGKVVEALRSLRTVAATSARDWTRSKEEAWIWGVLWGWGPLEEGDIDARDEVAAKHRWDVETMRRLHAMSLAVNDAIAASGEESP